jgi:hypothetical protein
MSTWRDAIGRRLKLRIIQTFALSIQQRPHVSNAQKKTAIRRPLAERIRSTQSVIAPTQVSCPRTMVNLNSAFRFAVVEC